VPRQPNENGVVPRTLSMGTDVLEGIDLAGRGSTVYLDVLSTEVGIRTALEWSDDIISG
jgi:hypothetical protein